MPPFVPNTSGVKVSISTSLSLLLYFLFFSFSCSLKIVAVCLPLLGKNAGENAGENCKLFLGQVHLIVLHSDEQLHLIKWRSDSWADCKSVATLDN